MNFIVFSLTSMGGNTVQKELFQNRTRAAVDGTPSQIPAFYL